MASQTRSAGLGRTVDNIWGTVDWVNPTNIYSSNNVYSTAILDFGEISHYLTATDFGFTIPEDATIDGIVVEIERKAADALAILDNHVYIVKTGTEEGNNKASVTEWPTSDAYASYGGVADKWGVAWGWGDINDIDFGVSINASNSGEAEEDSTAYVDHIRITVYYTEAAGTNMKINIGDAFKDVDEIKINIGDSWKTVTKIQINIGDVWKDIFG